MRTEATVEPRTLAPIDAKSPAETAATSRRTANMRCDVAGGICVLTFDCAHSSANTFDCARLLELEAHLDWVEHAPGVRGLVFASAKEKVFVAGADIHALAGMADPSASPARFESELREMVQLGQRVFNRIATLKIPTVAAIHGACLGGGCELALACGYRMASDSHATKIGLPETRLGIVPAWGGCTRLPRLIGIPRALDVILSGKSVSADDALKSGLVDEVVPREQLLDAARERIVRPAVPHRPHLLVSNNPVSAMLIRNHAARELAVKTRGNYPAMFEAIEVVTHGASLPFDQALARERDAIQRLAATTACQNLLRLFMMKERAKKSGLASKPVSRAAVIGAGVMGAGIAQWASSRGISVILRDVSLDCLVRGMAMVSDLYEDAVKHHHLTALEARDGKDRIFPAATDLPLRDVEFVIEAAVEKLSVKRDIFRCLAAQAPSTAILATNTSALSISEIAAATPCPERVVGMHFFNPVHRMELVEIIAGAKTSTDTLVRTAEFARRLGKLPVIVKDSPGFIVNRILMPYLAEAVRLFDAGASAQEIDEAMLDFGMPMGPLRLLDEVGIDVASHVASTLGAALGERVLPSPLLEKMIGANMLGRKTGRGFYEHLSGKPNHHADVMRRVHRHAHFTHDELAARMSLLMVNEAARCLEEEITGGAEIIDFAMVMGAGFAPFRGGPLRHADAMGVGAVVEELDRLAKTEPRFTPCGLLRSMAPNGDLFHGRSPGCGSPDHAALAKEKAAAIAPNGETKILRRVPMRAAVSPFPEEEGKGDGGSGFQNSGGLK